MYNELVKSNLEKEKHFYSYEYLENLKGKLSIFISSWIPEDTKPKVSDQIRLCILKNAVYESQIYAMNCIKAIEITHILSMNEVGVEINLIEWKELAKSLKEVKKKFQLLKPFEPCKEVIKTILDSFEEERISHFIEKDKTQIYAHIISNHKMGDTKMFNEVGN